MGSAHLSYAKVTAGPEGVEGALSPEEHLVHLAIFSQVLISKCWQNIPRGQETTEWQTVKDYKQVFSKVLIEPVFVVKLFFPQERCRFIFSGKSWWTYKSGIQQICHVSGTT